MWLNDVIEVLCLCGFAWIVSHCTRSWDGLCAPHYIIAFGVTPIILYALLHILFQK